MFSRLRSVRAFTLIELLVVVAIIGILVAVAAPSFISEPNKADDSAAQQMVVIASREAKADFTAAGQSFASYVPGNGPGSLVGALQASEPQYSFSWGIPNTPQVGTIDVNVPASADNAQVELCTLSRDSDSTFFCVLADEAAGLTLNADADDGGLLGVPSAHAQASALGSVAYVSALSEGAALCVMSAIADDQSVSGECTSSFPAGQYATSWSSSALSALSGGGGGGTPEVAPTFTSAASTSPLSPLVGTPEAVSFTAPLGTPTPSVALQWYDCSTLVLSDPSTSGSCAKISGTLAQSTPYTPLSADAGKYLAAVLSASSAAGVTDTYSTPALVNAAPGGGSASISPASPTSGVQETASATGFTGTPTPSISSYTWYDCATAGANPTSGGCGSALGTGTTYTPTSSGGYLSVVASASNGISPSARAYSTPALVAGAPSELSAPSISATGTTVGSVLTASAGSWSASPSSYTFTWYDGCNSSGANCNSTPVQTVTPGGAGTTSTYALQSADEGGYIAVYVYATNGVGNSGSVESSNYPGPVQGAPVNTTAPSVSGTVSVGYQLSASTGAWSPTGTPSYQWQDCNAAGSDCTNASGTGNATSTYTISAADEGYFLEVKVSETNAAGTSFVYAAAPSCGAIGSATNGIGVGFGGGADGAVTMNPSSPPPGAVWNGSSFTLYGDICATTFNNSSYSYPIYTNGWRILATQSITLVGSLYDTGQAGANVGSITDSGGEAWGIGASGLNTGAGESGSVGGGVYGGYGGGGGGSSSNNASPAPTYAPASAFLTSSTTAIGGAGGNGGPGTYLEDQGAGSNPWSDASTPLANTNLLVGGGGGGGGAGSSAHNVNYGGNGGGGGGVIALAAPTLNLASANFYAYGGNGGEGESNPASCDGGGGGGGGGAVVLFGSISGTYGDSVSGGSGGPDGHGGNGSESACLAYNTSQGAAGANGTVYTSANGAVLPTVNSVSPSTLAPGVSNQNVTITGANFASEAMVAFSNPGIAVNSVTYNSSTSLSANITISAGAPAGAGNVTVENYTGAGTGAGVFTVS